jgi:hypothetical protein
MLKHKSLVLEKKIFDKKASGGEKVGCWEEEKERGDFEGLDSLKWPGEIRRVFPLEEKNCDIVRTFVDFNSPFLARRNVTSLKKGDGGGKIVRGHPPTLTHPRFSNRPPPPFPSSQTLLKWWCTDSRRSF